MYSRPILIRCDLSSDTQNLTHSLGIEARLYILQCHKAILVLANFILPTYFKARILQNQSIQELFIANTEKPG